MSSFSCPVVRVTIEPHPNADAIELALVGGYVSIVKKGQFKTGDLAVYIPEQSVLPEWLLKEMGFWDDMNNKGMLTSSAGNRVKAIRLRGVFSQGLLYPVADQTRDSLVAMVNNQSDAAPFDLDSDVSEWLGITKWEPTVPAHMAGKVAGGDLDATIHYDFENLKKVMDIFDDGMEVVITEKIHGTLLQVGIVPKNIWEGKSWAEKCPLIGETEYRGIVTSKGQGAKGLMLDPSDVGNLYVSACRNLGLWNKLLKIAQDAGVDPEQPVYLLGEIFGQGIQDLEYGQPTTFRAFDIFVGNRNKGVFFNAWTFEQVCSLCGIDTVPVLYVGAYSYDTVLQHTDGNTVLTKDKHIREGVVVKAMQESRHPRHGRRIAKSVSQHYLLRKGETTEFQ